MSKISVPLSPMGFNKGAKFGFLIDGFQVNVLVNSPKWKDSEFILSTTIDGVYFEQEDGVEPELWSAQEFLYECILSGIQSGRFKVVAMPTKGEQRA